MSTKPDGEIEVIIICSNFCSPLAGSLNPRPIKTEESATAYTDFITGALEGKSVLFEASEKLKGLKTHQE